ncbi:MAG TPA: hypothetical protein VNB49_02275, partial [Candidatus Dormibacteraeota bacterium]|nr:hypothetical protein [Candidatus Dormibacteraeota bacterium]
YGTTFANARPPGVSRNSLEGPGFVALNLRLAKTFQLLKSEAKKNKKEGASAALAVDAFNVLNYVNLGQPVGNFSSPFFGLPVSAATARRLQASLGFQF